jgi:hypothetical protein
LVDPESGGEEGGEAVNTSDIRRRRSGAEGGVASWEAVSPNPVRRPYGRQYRRDIGG